MKAGTPTLYPRLAVSARPRVTLRGDDFDFGPPKRPPSPWMEEQTLRANDPDWWKLEPGEQDEVLAASSGSIFGGAHVEILKSVLFNMDEGQAESLPASLRDKRSLRLSMLGAKRFPELATEDSPLGRAWRMTLAPPEPAPAPRPGGGFRFGSCSQDDPLSMGGWVPDGVERAICYGVHTVIIVGGLVAAMVVLRIVGEAVE